MFYNIMNGCPARAGLPRTVRLEPDFSPMDSCPVLSGMLSISWMMVQKKAGFKSFKKWIGKHRVLDQHP